MSAVGFVGELVDNIVRGLPWLFLGSALTAVAYRSRGYRLGVRPPR